MEDWQVAIGIIGIAIIIAIILSKRSWARKRKSKPIEHYTKSRDKLSGVDDDGESPPPIAIVVLLLLGALLLFGLYKLATWFFVSAAPKIVAWITAPVNNTASAVNTTGWTDMGVVGGQLGLPSNLIIVLVVALFILVFMFMFGGRWVRRNSLILFMFALPILVVLGMPIRFIIIISIFVIPIIVFRGMRVLA